MQSFNTNTIVSGYIAKLLQDTYVPTIPVVSNIQNAPAGPFICDRAIRVKTDSAIKTIRSYTFGERLLNQSSNFVSNQLSYTTQMHEALGRYLRFYRDYYDIDLMPFYNCCSNRYFDIDLPVTSIKDARALKSDNKVLCFPIAYNTFYSIHIHCNSSVSPVVQPMFFNGTYLVDIDNTVFKPISNWKSFYVPQTKDSWTEKYLWLFVQLPSDSTVNSNIVVIEEGRIELSAKATSSEYCSPVSLVTNNSLITTNYNKQVPFSDRLIEYLFENVIIEGVANQYDIERVRKVIGENNIPDNYTGHFTNDVHKLVYNKYRQLNLLDFNGYVDKDVEWAMFGEHNYYSEE